MEGRESEGAGLGEGCVAEIKPGGLLRLTSREGTEKKEASVCDSVVQHSALICMQSSRACKGCF